MSPAFGIVLGIRSGGLCGERLAGANGVDDVADGPSGLGRSHLVLRDHRVLGVWQRAMRVVRRQRGELVLRGSSFVPNSIANPNATPAISTYVVDATVGTISQVTTALGFDAPVVLPNGATVTALRLDAFDAVANDFSMVMLADPFGSGVATNMASTVSSGTGGVVTVADVTIDSPVVNNATNSYALRLCVNAGLIFYDARIDYTTP